MVKILVGDVLHISRGIIYIRPGCKDRCHFKFVKYTLCTTIYGWRFENSNFWGEEGDGEKYRSCFIKHSAALVLKLGSRFTSVITLHMLIYIYSRIYPRVDIEESKDLTSTIFHMWKNFPPTLFLPLKMTITPFFLCLR